jgi:hypothetical protein
MWIVVKGSPFDGLELIGPFESSDAAYDWADENTDEPNWIRELTSPDDA